MLKLKLIHPKCARFSEKHSHQHVDHMLKQNNKCLSSQTLYFTAVICVFSTITGVAHHIRPRSALQSHKSTAVVSYKSIARAGKTFIMESKPRHMFVKE